MYKDSDTQKAYQRRWLKERRAAYLVGKHCLFCGSTERLVLSGKPHSFFSLSKKSQEKYTIVPLCYECRYGTPEEIFMRRVARNERRKREGGEKKLKLIEMQELKERLGLLIKKKGYTFLTVKP